MVLPTGELPFSVTFERADGALSATMDIPAQSVLDLLLTAVSYADGRVHFELHAPIGLAVWDGAHEGDTIEGEFTQGAARGTFSVERAAVVEPESDEPIPYREKEVSFETGDVHLEGTLTLPEGTGPFPAVVMITGSGPQQRSPQFWDTPTCPRPRSMPPLSAPKPASSSPAFGADTRARQVEPARRTLPPYTPPDADMSTINRFLGRINHFLGRALGTLNAIAAVLLLIPVVSISSAWEDKLGYGVGFLVFMIGIIGIILICGFVALLIDIRDTLHTILGSPQAQSRAKLGYTDRSDPSDPS